MATILRKETNTSINISVGVTVLTYTRPTADGPAIVLPRVELGDPNPIAGGADYTLSVVINGAVISPESVVRVPSGRTHTLMQSREVTLEGGDIISLKVDGAPADVAVSTIAIIQDATPIGDEDLDAVIDRVDDILGLGGSVIVNHNFGGDGNLRYQTIEGVPVGDATIHVFRALDYNAGRRTKEFIVASTLTDAFGDWERDIMLDPGAYIIFVFKAGLFGPDLANLTIA